ncbi:MAG: sugar transferase [Ruminococcaceae bacterium]|nr:sugar transferase [Oscillospiraceae bacterium]
MNSVEIKPEIQILEKTILDRKAILRRDRGYWIFRRAQDIFLSLLALLVLWPVLLVIAIVIVIDSPGAGPIYSQKRVGRNGKEFKFYKFRSMCPNADKMLDQLLDQNEMEGPVFKIKEDPRITRVGKFIRKTSIDELPQLFNVLKGDMSIVGPRPALPREVEQYTDYERQRLYVTPGLTCYWQIQPRRNSLSFYEWLDLDLKYIQERSFWTDWKIIFKTFGAVLGMNGE